MVTWSSQRQMHAYYYQLLLYNDIYSILYMVLISWFVQINDDNVLLTERSEHQNVRIFTTSSY